MRDVCAFRGFNIRILMAEGKSTLHKRRQLNQSITINFVLVDLNAL